MHKKCNQIPKGRPIIAACGSNTERISWLLDSLGKDTVKKQTSFIKDTPDILRKFAEINESETLLANAKPYSIDIKSFYTNIHLEEGIKAFKETLDEIPDKSIPTDYLIKLLKLVMECNIFKFNEEFWIQLIGTSMGTRVAPTYANIFMGKLEKFMLEKCPESLKPCLHTWRRFIDDIFLIWIGTDQQFDEFFSFLNNFHQTIKFDDPQHHTEDNSCDFLDLHISIKDGKIETDLYRKETSKPTALLPSSAHPGHITSNIIYSMAFRILRICSEEENFDKRLLELKNNFLIPRNYHSKVIDSQFKRVKNLPGESYSEKRKNALKKKEIKENENKGRVIAPVDFNPSLPNLSGIFAKHFKAMIFRKPELKETFEHPPMPAYRQPPNLRKIICRSTLPQIKREDNFTRKSHRSAPGWKKCGRGSTTCCPYTLPAATEVTGLYTNFKHKIRDAVNCETENCIYYWRCLKSNCKSYPKCEYVGLTRRRAYTNLPFLFDCNKHSGNIHNLTPTLRLTKQQCMLYT